MKRLLIINILLCASFWARAQFIFTDFENANLTNFSTDGTTSLNISSEHVKSGTKALEWTAENGKKLIVTNLNIQVDKPKDASTELFVYNAEPSNDKLIFEFTDNSGNIKRTGTMLLNFKGWRDYHRNYREDYNNGATLPKFLLKECRITYVRAEGTTGTRKLYFDNLTFIGDPEVRQPGPHMALDYQHFFQEKNAAEDPLGSYLKKPNFPVIPSASPEELTGLQTIRNSYTRATGPVDPSAVIAAETYVDNCGIGRNVDGTIKGRGMLGISNPDTLVLVSTHIQSLARAARFNGDANAKSKLILFTEYILDQGIAEGGRNDMVTNSYTNVRTFPIGFFEALPLYAEPMRTEVINLLKWSNDYNKIYELNPTPGQNTDFLYLKVTFLIEIACALTSDDEAVNDLKYIKYFLERNTDISEGDRDGIKLDGTGFHHKSNQVRYLYAFGGWVERAYSLKGTPFRVNKAAYDNMAFAFKNMFLQSSRGGLYSNAATGRVPFQASLPVSQTQLWQLVEIGGDIIGSSFEPDLAAFYNYTYNVDYYGVAKGDYDNFYTSNYSNLGVLKRGNWTASMKGFNTIFKGTEIYPTENRYGRYQSYGALEILYNGSLEDTGYILNGAGWDWNYMPGTTSVVLPFSELQPKTSNASEWQELDFSGALSLGKNGIFGMDFSQLNKGYYTPSSLKFKKSVFAFDNLLICLGSDISVGNNQGKVVSNLFQAISTTATPTMYVNSTVSQTGTFDGSYPLTDSYQWLTSSQGTGFYLPKGNNDYRVEGGSQTTPVYTTTDGSVTSTANFTRAYLVHGNQPTTAAPAKYEYVVAPNIAPADMQTLAQTLASGSVYTVLNQTSEFHAIKYIPDNSTSYVVFSKAPIVVNVGLVESVSGQAMFNVKEYGANMVLVTLNNPDLNMVIDANKDFIATNPHFINLGLTGDYTIVSNPNSSSVNQQGNLLTVGFTVKDGLPSSILLQKNTVTPIKLVNFNGALQNAAVQLNWTSAEEKNVNKFVLYRSADGINFDQITQVTAKGNSSQLIKYNYTDKDFDTFASTVYYKLQSIDTDGSISSEKTIAIKLPEQQSKISFYPNPVSSYMTISLEAEEPHNGEIRVYSLSGKLEFNKKVDLKQGFNHFPIFLQNLNTGEYIIQLKTNKINATQKFIKL